MINDVNKFSEIELPKRSDMERELAYQQREDGPVHKTEVKQGQELDLNIIR